MRRFIVVVAGCIVGGVLGSHLADLLKLPEPAEWEAR